MKKTLKIRHYIIGLMYKAGGSSIQIMSARDLADNFGIACSTVALALKELTEEGYIFSRPGIGNFTNPLRMPVYRDREMPSLIGVMFGDGRFFYIGSTIWKTYRALGDAIFDAGWNLRNIELDGPLDAESAIDIIDNKIDALIWIGAYDQQEFASKIIESGIPLITDSSVIKGANSVESDYTAAMEFMLEQMMVSGQTDVLLYQPPEISYPLSRSLSAILKKRNLKLSIEAIDPTKFPHEQLIESYFDSHKKVTAVACHNHPSSGSLADHAAGKGAILSAYEFAEGSLNGKKASYIRGKTFAETVVNRLNEIMGGDKTIKHLSAALELVEKIRKS